MEMPITVIITLFVAVVVAGALIAFFQNVILEGKQSIKDINPDDEESQDKLIELSSVSADDIRNLAIQCAKDIRAAPDEELCYIVNADSFVGIDALDGETIVVDGAELTINVDVAANYNALLIRYNPLGSIDIKT